MAWSQDVGLYPKSDRIGTLPRSKSLMQRRYGSGELIMAKSRKGKDRIIAAVAAAMFAFSGPSASGSDGRCTDNAKCADSALRAACQREATLELLRTHLAREKWVANCINRRQVQNNGKRNTQKMRPAIGTAAPRVMPLATGSPSSGGNTLPSNAPIEPSAPIVGSSGNSTTGSRATSTSGSSGTSVGGSAGSDSGSSSGGGL